MISTSSFRGGSSQVAAASKIATVAAAALTIVLWASAFVGIRVAARSFGGGALALFRFGVASAALLAFAAVRRPRLPSRRELAALALVGLSGVALYHAALNEGERSVAAGTASLLIASAPVFTALLSRTFLGERLGVRGAAGVALAFAGVALIGRSGDGTFRLDRGAALVLGAAVLQAIYFVLQKPLLRSLSAFEVTSYSVWLGTAMLLVFAPALVRDLAAAPRESVLATVYLGVFPGAVANALWAFVLSRAPAARAAASLFLVTPIAFLLGWGVLGEVPSMAAVAGGALSMLGVALVVLGRSARGIESSRRPLRSASPCVAANVGRSR